MLMYVNFVLALELVSHLMFEKIWENYKHVYTFPSPTLRPLGESTNPGTESVLVSREWDGSLEHGCLVRFYLYDVKKFSFLYSENIPSNIWSSYMEPVESVI